MTKRDVGWVYKECAKLTMAQALRTWADDGDMYTRTLGE